MWQLHPRRGEESGRPQLSPLLSSRCSWAHPGHCPPAALELSSDLFCFRQWQSWTKDPISHFVGANTELRKACVNSNKDEECVWVRLCLWGAGATATRVPDSRPAQASGEQMVPAHPPSSSPTPCHPAGSLAGNELWPESLGTGPSGDGRGQESGLALMLQKVELLEQSRAEKVTVRPPRPRPLSVQAPAQTNLLCEFTNTSLSLHPLL